MVEQTPITLPAEFKGRFKRPDFLVEVPLIGQLAIEVKAKQPFRGQLIFELAEVEKLAMFGITFHATAFFVCIDSSRDTQLWVPLSRLTQLQPSYLRKRKVVSIAAEQAIRVDPSLSFGKVFRKVTDSAMSGGFASSYEQ